MTIKRALISVSDKTGVVEFAKGLHELGVEIVSTGGTLKTIAAAGIPVIPVSEVTGFPEMMDGRVKTLHPKIHGGILAIRDNPEHVKAMKEHGITGIDLVAVNLYPFRETIARPDVTLAEAIENIDIGGPSMVRAAAKNYKYVTIVVDPKQYDEILERIKTDALTEEFRLDLSRKAFIKLRGELIRLYQKQCELHAAAQSDSETALVDSLLADLEGISRQAHEETGFTYTPLSELAALN